MRYAAARSRHSSTGFHARFVLPATNEQQYIDQVVSIDYNYTDRRVSKKKGVILIPLHLYDREQILTACRAVFARHGYDNTTTAMLAEAAGISKALIFHHFGSKKDLYLSVLMDCLQLAKARMRLQALPEELDFFAAMLEFGRMKLAFFKDNPDVYRMIMEAAYSPSTEVVNEIAARHPELQNWQGKGWKPWFSRVPLKNGVDRQLAFELVTLIIMHSGQEFLADVQDISELDADCEEQSMTKLRNFLNMIRWGIEQEEEEKYAKN